MDQIKVRVMITIGQISVIFRLGLVARKYTLSATFVHRNGSRAKCSLPFV